MIKFKLLPLLLIVLSCKSLEKPLSYYTGEYKFQDEITSGKLTLKGDNRFKFSYSAHLLKVHSEGKWYVEKNRIFLLSDEDYKNDYIMLRKLNQLQI